MCINEVRANFCCFFLLLKGYLAESRREGGEDWGVELQLPKKIDTKCDSGRAKESNEWRVSGRVSQCYKT